MSSLLLPASGNSNNTEKKRYSVKTLLKLRNSKYCTIKPDNFNEPDYGKFDLGHTREGSGDRSLLPPSANFRGRERREPQGAIERGKRGAPGAFFKANSFDQREETNWDNKQRRNEPSKNEPRKGNQRTPDGTAPAPTDKKKRDVWTLGSLSGDDLTHEEQARREEFEKFRKHHQNAGDKSGTAESIFSSSSVVSEPQKQQQQQPKQQQQQAPQPTGGQMFMSSDFFSNLTLGDDDSDMDPLAHFNPDMMMSGRKTSSMLFGEAENNVDALEKDLFRDLRFDDKLGNDMDAPFNPEQMFADILGMDQSNSMPPTPTHMFNAVPEGMFFKPPMQNHMNMPHPSEMTDLSAIEGEFLPKGAPPKSNNQQNAPQFDINNLFMKANIQEQHPHNMMPMMPPHIMPQHLLHNHSPYMNIPYNPSSFPPQTQQFIDPYQEYLLQQQREQAQHHQQHQKQQPSQPQPHQQPVVPSPKQPEQKGKVKRQSSMVPPQLQKQLGKSITDISPAKKKEEEKGGVKGKNNKKPIPKQKSPQNVQNLSVNTQPQILTHQNSAQMQQQPFSPLQKWFGANVGAAPVQMQNVPQQNFVMPQNAMSLEEIEASLVSRK